MGERPDRAAAQVKQSANHRVAVTKDAPRRYGKGAAMRETILTKALARLARSDDVPRSLRGLSREIGLEAAHVLYYFSTYENLLKCVLHRWDEEAAKEPLAAGAVSTLDRYVVSLKRNLTAPGMVRLYFEFAADALDPEHPSNGYFRQRFAYMQAELSDAFRAGQQDGIFDPTLDPEHCARSVIALADGLQLQALLGAPVDAADGLQRTIDSYHVRDSG